ncbi:hypothetical protein OOK31_26295 [Streptomyces sp. NBC_00249]|uniref:hypothetical protein n=1 Tax=Streptomyces sp. NBC_00249 TaxID=2975690 RepID=UPI002258EB49|nr:hypothetical protein [Streptomyces sp. NBC_00249]MCX5197362.1 hypothetical protein [Streptomyces sp. NBC_00249]
MSITPARPPRRYRRAAVAVTAAVLLTGAGAVAVASATPTPAPKAESTATQVANPRWEYRWALAQPGGKNVGDLEKLGKEGWEAVAPVNAYTGDRWNFLLKRQLTDQ